MGNSASQQTTPTDNITLSKQEYIKYQQYLNQQNKKPPTATTKPRPQEETHQHYLPGKSRQHNYAPYVGINTSNRQDPRIHSTNRQDPRIHSTNRQTPTPVPKRKSSIDMNTLDPFRILEKKNYTLPELRQKYKKLAIIHHPDKGGSSDTFNILMTSYEYIGDIIERLKADKTHTELKNDYQTASKKETPKTNTQLSEFCKKDNFDLNKFNHIYEQTKFKTNVDDGYGNIMTDSSKERDDIEIQNTIGTYKKQTFQRQFENTKKQTLGNQVMKYTPPEALEPSYTNYTILGEENISDFSGKRGGIEYTDYKKAYQNGFLINTDQVGYKTYRSIEELEEDRGDIDMNEEQRRAVEKKEEFIKKKEWNRQNRIKEYDANVEKQYNKINKLMLR